MKINLTGAELKKLRWLLNVVLEDQEQFLDDETDKDARREAERAQRAAEELLARLDRRSSRSPKRDSLSRAQLDQQDAVDNAIYRLLNELRPAGIAEIPWCQSCLAVVRFAVLKALREHAAISNAQFYPALGDQPSARQKRGVR